MKELPHTIEQLNIALIEVYEDDFFFNFDNEIKDLDTKPEIQDLRYMLLNLRDAEINLPKAINDIRIVNEEEELLLFIYLLKKNIKFESRADKEKKIQIIQEIERKLSDTRKSIKTSSKNDEEQQQKAKKKNELLHSKTTTKKKSSSSKKLLNHKLRDFVLNGSVIDDDKTENETNTNKPYIQRRRYRDVSLSSSSSEDNYEVSKRNKRYTKKVLNSLQILERLKNLKSKHEKAVSSNEEEELLRKSSTVENDDTNENNNSVTEIPLSTPVQVPVPMPSIQSELVQNETKNSFAP